GRNHGVRAEAVPAFTCRDRQSVGPAACCQDLAVSWRQPFACSQVRRHEAGRRRVEPGEQVQEKREGSALKIIKPLRMTIMPRPYRWRGGIYLAVSVAVLVRHDAHGPKVQAEHFLVHDVLPELDADEMMDMVMTKPQPEILVRGQEYHAHQKHTQECS